MALVDLFQFPHFIVMLVGFIHLSIAMLLVAFHKPKKWYSLHLIFAATGVELIVIGLLILSGLILGIPHGIIGLIAAIILIGELIVGYIAIKTKERKIRITHIWVSRVIYIVTLVALILGVLNFI
ncbi:MAG: hypothetical protein HWN81_20610 [Candidatus Lokiarchaeota archaeon]|nr:hypothetical protein [Candidatus Lokiarchaeota archaeon]